MLTRNKHGRICVAGRRYLLSTLRLKTRLRAEVERQRRSADDRRHLYEMQNGHT